MKNASNFNEVLKLNPFAIFLMISTLLTMKKDISVEQGQWVKVPLLLEKNKVAPLSCSVVTA